jgi:hypothetical protein
MWKHTPHRSEFVATSEVALSHKGRGALMHTLAESQRKQARTQQKNAGDGHREEGIGFEFFAHGTNPASVLKTGSGASGKIVSADLNHSCTDMPAVKPAIFAVEQGEQFPHRSAPVASLCIDIRPSFLRVFAVLGIWFRDRAACFIRGLWMT